MISPKKHWTPTEDDRLLNFIEVDGLTSHQAGERLGRSSPSVRGRLRVLRATIAKQAHGRPEQTAPAASYYGSPFEMWSAAMDRLT